MRGEEDRIQKSVVDYLEWVAPSVLVVPVPNHINGGGKNINILKHKRQLMPGATDTIWTWPGPDGQARVAFVEFKSANGDLRDRQLDFRRKVLNRGAHWAVIAKFEPEEIDALLAEFGVPRGTAQVKRPPVVEPGAF